MTFYGELPTNSLVGFYYEMQKNIDRGKLSDAMYQEMNLIKIEAKKRGVLLLDLKQRDK